MLAILGCGGPLDVVSFCNPDAPRCDAPPFDSLDPGDLPTRGGDCPQITTPPVQVDVGDHAEFCQVLDLDSVHERGTEVFISAFEMATLGPQQQVFVYRRPITAGAPLAEGYYDDCQVAFDAGGFQPMIGTIMSLDLGERAIAAADGDQLLFSTHYQNVGDEPDDVVAKLNLLCGTDTPPVYVHHFAFSGQPGLAVAPHKRDVISGVCTFQKPLSVLSVYRQPFHDMERFSFTVVGPSSRSWSMQRDDKWKVDLKPPVGLDPGDGFAWTCEYLNQDDVPLPIDVGGAAGCSLFGFYQLRDGSRDEDPERCQTGP